jgi:hypothetical protein
MADRVSARRGIANTFFLTIDTTLGSVLAFVQPSNGSGVSTRVFGGVIGLTLSLVWFVSLRSYRRLNSAKYQVILKLEEQLPIQPFGDEWERLTSRPRADDTTEVARWWRRRLRGVRSRWVRLRDQYTELTDVENVVPIIFGVVYAGLIIAAVFGK